MPYAFGDTYEQDICEKQRRVLTRYLALTPEQREARRQVVRDRLERAKLYLPNVRVPGTPQPMSWRDDEPR